MKWVYLALGIIFEVFGTISMKYADGFTKLVPSVLTFLFYGLCLIPLVMVLKKMDASVAYAIWASMGVVLLTIIGVVWFKEPLTIVKVLSILLITIGILGLELFD
jgi:small multidrug resistance pump